MQPMHAKIKHSSKCPCCRSNYSSGNSGSKKDRKALQAAKSAARQIGKRQMLKEFD